MKNCIVILLILLVAGSCSILKQPPILKGKRFIDDDPYSSKISYLDFVNDSICLYHQRFKDINNKYIKDIDDKYKQVKIICKYKIKRNKIILETIDCPDFLTGLTCYVLPDSIRNVPVSEFISNNQDLLSEEEIYIFKTYLYGHINGITVDTLTYHNNYIFYFKMYNCVYPNGSAGMGRVFREESERILSNEKKLKMFMSNKYVINGSMPD